MQVGTQFSQPALGLPPRRAIASYTRLVETAAAAGFDSFWAGQHFMPGDYQLFQPLPLLARLSAAVPDLTLGTSVILLVVYALGLLFTLRTHSHIFSMMCSCSLRNTSGEE